MWMRNFCFPTIRLYPCSGLFSANSRATLFFLEGLRKLGGRLERMVMCMCLTWAKALRSREANRSALQSPFARQPHSGWYPPAHTLWRDPRPASKVPSLPYRNSSLATAREAHRILISLVGHFFFLLAIVRKVHQPRTYHLRSTRQARNQCH